MKGVEDIILEPEDDQTFECFDEAHDLLSECKVAANISILDSAIDLLESAARGFNAGDPQLKECQTYLTTALLTRFVYMVDISDVHKALVAHTRSLGISLQDISLSSETDSVSSAPAADMTSALEELTLFNQTVNLDHLTSASSLYRQTISVEEISAEQKGTALLELAQALLMHFYHTAADEANVNCAVSHLKEAVEIQPNLAIFLVAGLLTAAQIHSHTNEGRVCLLEATDLLGQTVRINKEALQLAHAGQESCSLFEQSGDKKEIDAAIANVEQAIWCLSFGHPSQAVFYGELGRMLVARCQHFGDPKDLEEAINLHRMVLTQTPELDPNYTSFLNHLAATLECQFKQMRDFEALDESIELLEEVVSLHPDDSIPLNNLESAVQTRFDHKGDSQDLDKVIELHEKALTLDSGSQTNHMTILSNLANALQRRFEEKGNPQDLEDAIKQQKEALEGCPEGDPAHSSCLNNLARSLQIRYQKEGNEQDLETAIGMHKDALSSFAATHADRSMSLNNLGDALRMHFQLLGDPKDLAEAIRLHTEALKLCPFPHPDHGPSLNNLANAFQIQFEQQGNFEDLDEAIQLRRRAALFFVAPAPAWIIASNNLATIVLTRFEHKGDFKDLDEAIKVYKEVLAHCHPTHPHKSGFLSNLAHAIQTRFEQKGDPQDLEEAIRLHRESLGLSQNTDPDHHKSLNNLARAIGIRFLQTGFAKDLEETVKLSKEALALCPAPHPDYGVCLNNVSSVLTTQCEQTGDFRDLEDVIRSQREVLALWGSPHPQHFSALNNLAATLNTRYQRKKKFKDLEEGIELYDRVVSLCTATHPERSTFLYNLANTLQTRFELKHEPEDLQRAIDLHEEALALRPVPHLDHGISLNRLGCLLASAHKDDHDSPQFQRAMSLLQEASAYLYTSPLLRFRCTHSWAQVAAEHGHSSALHAYQETINILPQIAALHLDIVSRQEILSTLQASELASGAAACAIKEGSYTVALELLEASRSIFWSQAMHLQTPLDRLETVDARLASKLCELTRELEHASFRGISTSDNQEKILATEAIGIQYERLNKEWETAVQSARSLTGFENFMKPQDIETLNQAAASGPVIILVPRESESFALIQTFGNPVQYVQLPALDISAAHFQADLSLALSRSNFDAEEFLDTRSHRETLASPDVQDRLCGHKQGYKKPEETFQGILEELWRTIVKPVFDVLKLKKSTNPQRLWWCPTGTLTFLPIHAAGIYGKDGTDCVADYVISSYAPTLAALLNPPTREPTSFKMTAVIQSNKPKFSEDFSPLPGSRKEFDSIRNQVPTPWLTGLGIGTVAVVEDALTHLRQSSVVHFACHGTQDLDHPLESGLALSDGLLKVSEIMSRPEDETAKSLQQSNSLAFLSACETAKGDKYTPDEAMHLAGTLLFAGFRSVVATMWTMKDEDGPEIADKFYKHLLKDCDPNSAPPVFPDLTKSAEALHYAVLQLRKQPGISFRRWATFMHYGL
ncbi:CHAT domain-containing protein [Mycena polygramma]|nr:CHAT domain-containing protein [Mycena polygramma]